MITKRIVTEWLDDGLVASRWPVASDSLWGLMVPQLPDVPNRTMLLLGVCGNTVGKMALEKFPDLAIDLVDLEPQPEVPETIQSDAKDYLEGTQKTYDVIVIDLYTHTTYPEYLFSEDFISKLAEKASVVIIDLPSATDIKPYLKYFSILVAYDFLGNKIWRLKRL
jgi:hypothetical protein